MSTRPRRHIHRRTALAAVFVAAAAAAASEAGAQGSAVHDTAMLAGPPLVPPPITRSRPARVVVQLEARELVGELADGVDYTFWTFGGTVPGSFIRVREGDIVEFHLNNHPTSKHAHNIDLHAVTGPSGGAAASFVAPGQSSVFAFEALNPGLYVYHCATAPVGMHIANGMYGLILVEPREGLTPVDREYYVMQGEFYTDGEFGEAGHREFSMEEAMHELPDYVVFNGAVGALTGEGALSAVAGERVRLFVGNGGPNLLSSFHLIGEIFDRVFPDGARSPIENIQTAQIPPGGAAIAELTLQAPGTYVLVDHSMFRAFNKGALGNLVAGGPENRRVYAGRVAEDVYLLEGAAVQTVPTVSADTADVPPTLAERIDAGRRVYSRTCRACHQPDGQGVAGTFPPLAGSDFLNTSVERAIKVVLEGYEGPIVVNGRTYNAVMPALRLTDSDIANVLTYVYSRWDNAGEVVTTSQVRQIRLCPWCDEYTRPRNR